MFDQAVLEQRRVRDSEDGELKQKQMKSFLCPDSSAGRNRNPSSIITQPGSETEAQDHRRAAASDSLLCLTPADQHRFRCIVKIESD